MIANNDWAEVRAYQDGYNYMKGLTMTDERWTKYTLTLLVRDAFKVENVDTFWFGQWGGRVNLHKWDNTNRTIPLQDRDSAFSFGWVNRTIRGGKTLRLAVLLGVGRYLPSPPTVTVTSNFSEKYLPKQKFNVTGFVKAEKNVNLTLMYSFNGVVHPYFENNYTGENESFEQNFDIPFETPIQVGKYPLYIWATDSLGTYSNNFTVNILVNEAPKIQIVNRISDKYFMGGNVEVLSLLWDDTKANIHYKFDDDWDFSADNTMIECNREWKEFRKTFPLRETTLYYGSHTLYIWAEDEWNIKSDILIFPFNYIELHTPEIKIEQNEIPELFYRNNVTITGYVMDEDVGDDLVVEYKLPESNPLEPFKPYITFKNTNGEWYEFQMEYIVHRSLPENITHNVTFRVHDNKGAISFDKVFSFKVKKHTIIPFPEVTPMPTIDFPVIPDPIPVDSTTTYSETITQTVSETEDSNGDSADITIQTTKYVIVLTRKDGIPSQS